MASWKIPYKWRSFPWEKHRTGGVSSTRPLRSPSCSTCFFNVVRYSHRDDRKPSEELGVTKFTGTNGLCSQVQSSQKKTVHAFFSGKKKTHPATSGIDLQRTIEGKLPEAPTSDVCFPEGRREDFCQSVKYISHCHGREKSHQLGNRDSSEMLREYNWVTLPTKIIPNLHFTTKNDETSWSSGKIIMTTKKQSPKVSVNSQSILGNLENTNH